MTSAIQLRRLAQSRDENARFSWLGRQLGSLIVAGYMAEPGETEDQMRFASTLSMDEAEGILLRKIVDNPEAPKENKPGSHERLLAAGIGRYKS